MIVLDSSAALRGLTAEGASRGVMAVELLAVPHLVDAEVIHALRSLVIRSSMSRLDADQALDRWSRLGLSRFDTSGLNPRIWQLRDNLSAYDATFVALAEALDVPLVTADARIARATGPRCPITVMTT